jgi:hypothetical protein
MSKVHFQVVEVSKNSWLVDSEGRYFRRECIGIHSLHCKRVNAEKEALRISKVFYGLRSFEIRSV